MSHFCPMYVMCNLFMTCFRLIVQLCTLEYVILPRNGRAFTLCMEQSYEY